MVQKSLPESAQHAPKRTTESSAVPKVEEKPRYNALDASSAAESDPFYIDTIHVKIIRNFLDRSLDLDINANRANCLRAGEEDKSFIHRTILRLKSLNRQAPDSLIDFIGSLVLEKPELATTADAENRVPILEAARFQVKIFYHIIDLIIPNRTRDQLKTACETGGQACPLWEIAEGRLNRHLLKGQTIVRRSEDTSRCLHDRVDLYGLLDADRILRHTIQVSLAAQGGETCLQYLIQETKFDSGFRGGDQIIPLETFKALIQLYPDSTFTSPLATGLSPLQSAIQLYESQSIDYELLYHVIEALVGRSPHSIFFCEPEGKSSRVSYRLLKDLKDVPKNKDSRLRAEELLKTTCIGAREIEYAKEKESSTKGLWVQKKNFLYWDAKLERQFMLNLTGGSLVLDEPYIKTIVEKSNIRFETVLDFVKLPYWNRPAKALLKSIENSSGNAKTVPKVETGPYRHIFDWLYKRGVRKIFTIDVDDDGPDPHTNATIRDALAKEPSKGVERCDFQVEVWKWKKFDICTDTIYEAAPTVKEVHLFSHGNTAVLKGWASPSGLARLPELTSLTINISPKNKHDATDCSFMEKDFKEQLVKQCNKLSSQNITINNHGLLNKNTPSDKHTEPETQSIGKPTKAEMKLKPDEWISRLANCQQFLKGINLEEKPSVKVALLDNGCNLTDLHTVQQGKSFNSFRSEYCIGDCEHGTEMARCIQSVWSKTELYVARLDDSRTEENQRFTISSCHEALQWALDMDVDIISMSWTFRRDDVNDAHKKKFVELVQEIVSSKKVILFASLPDGGPSIRIGNYAPVGLDGVIRIGSATVYGISSNDNFYAEPDFLLPGEQILPSGEQARGSSYATAHAAGLAAMVLYLVKVYCELEVDPPFNLEHAISEAKSCEGMAHMFRKLSQNNTGKRARHGDFVQPYRSFPNDFNSGLSERAILSGIVSEILPPTVRIPATY